MNKSKASELWNDLAKFVGLFVIIGLAAMVAVGLVYLVLGSLSDPGRHILATALLFAVPGAFVLGLQVGKAHVRGVERGLDLKISAKERAQPAARPVVSVQARPAVRHDDLLPKVPSAVIVPRRDDDITPIDL
jgi:hypothetical protein